jgi:hypothetical protein
MLGLQTYEAAAAAVVKQSAAMRFDQNPSNTKSSNSSMFQVAGTRGL